MAVRGSDTITCGRTIRGEFTCGTVKGLISVGHAVLDHSM